MNGEPNDTPRLVILTGKDRGRELELARDGLVIGRTKDADLVVKDKSISRRHAMFSRAPGGWTVRDMGSKNGVRVNNRQASEQGLLNGDVVTVGGIKFKFLDPASGVAPPPSPAPPSPAPPPPPSPLTTPISAFFCSIAPTELLSSVMSCTREASDVQRIILPTRLPSSLRIAMYSCRPLEYPAPICIVCSQISGFAPMTSTTNSSRSGRLSW